MIKSVCIAKSYFTDFKELIERPHEPKEGMKERINNQEWFVCKNCGCLISVEAK